MNETTPYKVTGGKVLQLINEFLETRNAQQAKRLELTEEVGANGYMSNSCSISGFSFEDGKIPKGWIADKHGGYKPSAKTPEGKALRERMKLPQIGAPAFQVMLGMWDLSFYTGGRIKYVSFEKIGDVFVLHIPVVEKQEYEEGKGQVGDGKLWTPPDDGCQKMKLSEYYAMKEEKELAAKT